MCGICGYASVRAVPIDPHAGRRMCETLAHRGPDGHGEAAVTARGDLHGWLGHRRLRVVDLSEAAAQPMRSDDGAVALTYNGEIYNFRELRAELRALGARFASQGDSEVVLRAYEAWGDACVERLDGMFALAVWDGRGDGRLLLARDRTGKKPLFYSLAGDRITFASEIKGLLACPWVPGDIDPEGIPEYLTYGYVPTPRTMFRAVAQVPPGCVMTYDAAGASEARPYWSALPAEGQDLRPSRAFHAEVARLLDEATRRRMVADVPLGALLSGGIDSSLVVGLMSRASPEPVHTFAMGFPEEASFDERAHARVIAERFGTRHTEHAVRMDAVSLLDRLLWHHDQPFGDSSAIPTYVVAQLARESVTVVLNGDGGDEVFGGYDRFRAASLSRLFPPAAARFARPLAARLPRGTGYADFGRRAQRFVERAEGTLLERYQSWIALAGHEMLPSLLRPELRQLAVRERIERSMAACYAESAALPDLDRILYANLRTYLPDDLSVKVDRTTMAHSLEARSPFLDTALIEYLARLPARHKIGLRQVKPVLRDSFGPLLPDSIWDRPKHGFGVPIHRWFRGELGTVFADEVLAPDARTGAHLDRAALGRMLAEHREERADHGARLWTVLSLERFLRRAEQPVEPRPPGPEPVLDAAPVG